jgi:hypothetical protein
VAKNAPELGGVGGDAVWCAGGAAAALVAGRHGSCWHLMLQHAAVCFCGHILYVLSEQERCVVDLFRSVSGLRLHCLHRYALLSHCFVPLALSGTHFLHRTFCLMP